MYSKSVSLALLGLTGLAAADPTWPSPNDELEEIMYQLTSFKARKFADTVSPCNNEASGPGRLNAAEWLRTGFHDMSTANTYFQTGGLDGSLQYELDSGENTGPGFKTTLEFMSKYVSPKTSLSDLIAAGVYASVRSCGGPIVPVRGGRIDAQEAGNTGVPQPQNSAFTFQQQFDRMGFNNVEMIQVTACGHTIGGVHNTEFPDIVPDANANDGQAPLDSTVAVFDNNVVTEYLSGKTKNPLVVGPSAKINKNSDFKVFNLDGNKTMEALTQKDQFNQVCKTVLQKMIEVVPPGVNLTDPILPYKVKPVDVELTLADGGLNLDFSGYIRVKTTCLPKNSITDLTITYKNRQGASECGNSGCDIKATVQGLGKGFDHTFSFFPIEAKIPVATGISSFTVTINHADGTKQNFDNNGHGYPIQDTILFQKPQSYILGSTGATTLVAAVHKDAVGTGAKAIIHYKTTQPDSPVPKLNSVALDMAKGQCIGDYTLFNVDHTIEGGLSYQSFVDLYSGDKSDSFNAVTGIGGSCFDFPNPSACSVEAKVVKAKRDDRGALIRPRAVAAVTAADEPTPTTSTTTTTTTTTTTSATPPPIPTHKPVVGGYTMLSCWSEGTVRALSGAATADDLMTNEKCMAFCSGYNYWGTEYGRECYCGNSLGAGSAAAPIEQCDMPCGGDATEYCGAGNRLELYKTTASITTPTGTLAHKPTISPYTMVGCWTEGAADRALADGTGTAAADMTNEKCATFCASYRYFGTEYSTECYCGSYLSEDSKAAPLDECNMTCGGDQFEYCGASNRLELYMNPAINGGTPEQPPLVGDYTLIGCQTEGNNTRALPDASTADDKMTNEVCATFCKDYEYFGTEYGRECYCGNALAASSTVAPKGDCKMSCGGSNVEYCGGSNRLSVYKKKAAVPPGPPTRR